ncbi:hypothetical protein D3273_27075 [Lichenibacterium minor]|uniref:Uncharacterized protein n=1 Tax=Lichenibacterium minor TaxID=2316528 RepID=A0A4Q2TZS2_9HYPH|nr:hypothetical protein [Lichenibacterium minor]RYC28858.1 hypothetical protein D3273_27075 [Lichenibacterium minor]
MFLNHEARGAPEARKSWFVFHHLATHFAFGTRETAGRYLRFLNRNRASDCFTVWKSDHHPSAQGFPHDDWTPHVVDMEKDMEGWED